MSSLRFTFRYVRILIKEINFKKDLTSWDNFHVIFKKKAEICKNLLKSLIKCYFGVKMTSYGQNDVHFGVFFSKLSHEYRCFPREFACNSRVDLLIFLISSTTDFSFLDLNSNRYMGWQSDSIILSDFSGLPPQKNLNSICNSEVHFFWCLEA